MKKALVYMLAGPGETPAQESARIELQRRACRDFALDQGWAVADEYADTGLPAKGLERPGLRALLARVRHGDIGAVVAWDLARLSRSIGEVASIKAMLAEWECEIALVCDPDPEGFHELVRLHNEISLYGHVSKEDSESE